MDLATPYAAPAIEARPLASRRTRLLAALADCFLWAVVPLVFVTFFPSGGAIEDPDLGIFGFCMILWFLALGACYAWQLATRGQTIGKRLLGLRIVRLDGSRATFQSALVVRAMVTMLLDLVPGFALVDALFIFRGDRRCLHDLIAGTKVVDARSR
jgi:uncharacterized RDD family membrane protein YckC